VFPSATSAHIRLSSTGTLGRQVLAVWPWAWPDHHLEQVRPLFQLSGLLMVEGHHVHGEQLDCTYSRHSGIT
jgi:hypothetical protein